MKKNNYDDFSKYEALYREGLNAKEAYLQSKKDNSLDFCAQIRMLRSVYNLSLDEVKILHYEADTGKKIEDQFSNEDIEVLERLLNEEL